jgi:hypothetical protein
MLMSELQIEALLASPPERAELVVQLFVKDGGQWGEVYRDEGRFWIDLYGSGSTPLRFEMDQIIQALTRSQAELSSRLNDL